jgi:archaeal flagellar protein FlaJ
MRFNKVHWIGIIFAVLILTVDLIFFLGDKIFWFLIGIGVVVLSLPFLTTFLIESNVQKEKDSRFLEFSRNLAESVKSGTPIGQSIINMKEKNFGSLTSHIHKLANQISLGIPINKAFETFANDIGSYTVKRAVSLIREAETAGGHIEDILDSVANSIYQIQKLRKERKSAIYNLVVQGYIIFFIFIGIMLVMQFKILPLTADTADIGSIGDFDADHTKTISQDAETLARPFLYLLLIQGIFTGFTIGKLAEGSIKSGIKHSFVLTIAAFLISTGAKAFL